MLRRFLKDESMKTWSVYAGMIALGSLGLFAGSHWFSSDDPEEPAALESESPEFSAMEDVEALVPTVPKPTPARLELNLPANQPLPLLKTVEQVLIQKTPEGDRVSRSSLELAVTMRLEEKAADGSQLLSVVYNRVRYRQDIAGRSFVFDSTVPSGPLPVEALPYKGLVGNGFSFWVARDNRMLKPVGLAEFLKRCIREVPPAQQQRVLSVFAGAAEESVANFVDDSIGILPPHPEVQEEAGWKRDRQLAKPVPLSLSSQCTLRRLTEQFAEIAIEGTITATKPLSRQATLSSDVQVVVRGGHSQGRCEIDRKTGLPIYSEIKRFLDMEVQLPDGRRFDQQKITTTTVRLLPEESSPAPSRIIHAGAEFPATN